MKDLTTVRVWEPPESFRKITSIDLHTAGEPLRIITGGWPDLPGDNILAQRRFQREHYDYLRRALMFEPRGHADMYGAILMPPVSNDANFGVLFMHNEGYSTMCGHGIIGLGMAAVELGFVPQESDGATVRIDTPAGLVTAYVDSASKRGNQVRFENVPSFVLHNQQQVEVPEIGRIAVDVAYGGAFYAFCDARQAGVGLRVEDTQSLIHAGRMIKKSVQEQLEIKHPFEEDLSFLYGTIFVGEAEDKQAHSRNVCIFAEGEVDRCPTGTGVSARAAIHYSRGELALKEPFIVESILGTSFTGKVLRAERFGNFEAVVPEVGGEAYFVGRNEWWIDPHDPLKDGFILR